MPPVTEHLQRAPLYVRWPPERATLAVELRLDLVPQLSIELARGAQQGIEIGGVMLGRLLGGPTPTLRVESIEMIRRRPEDGPVFLLNPDQIKLFHEICQAARLGSRAAIGLFRSHLRSEQLRPSLADRSLLAEQFGLEPNALLLVQGRPPHSSAFFVSRGNELPSEPAFGEFLLDEAVLKSLPEVPAEAPRVSTRPIADRTSSSRALWVLGALAVLFAALFIWEIAKHPLTASVNRSPGKISLTAASDGALVHIGWNHSAPEISVARGATLSIVDGTRLVKIPLGPTDLQFGSVEYRPRSKALSISMTLNMSGREISTPSVNWVGT